VAGVDEVMGVEADLAAAHVTTKRARERLALALREVGGGLYWCLYRTAAAGFWCACQWGARVGAVCSWQWQWQWCRMLASVWRGPGGHEHQASASACNAPACVSCRWGATLRLPRTRGASRA
jgi:hypothetical protein